jgi:hypothetical protein
VLAGERVGMCEKVVDNEVDLRRVALGRVGINRSYKPSNQQSASVASIKHQTVNEISCDARPDKVSPERPKGRCHGMMHTHLHCKQQEMKVVEDEVRVTSKEGKKRGINISQC